MKKEAAIIEYCNQFVEKLLNKNGRKEQYTGEDIKNFSPFPYLNSMIVKNLMVQWKIEQKKLQSPFFDYTHKEVQEHFKKFANILSRHISMDHPTFFELSKNSVYETLLLVSNPYDYFNNLIKDKNLKLLSLSDFKQISKYVKINSHVLKGLIDHLIKNNKTTVYEANNELEHVFEHLLSPPEDPEKYIKELSEIHPLDNHLLFGEPEQPQKTTPEKPTYEPPANTVLNDRFQPTDIKKSIVDIHNKIDNIQSSLSLNQRIMFVNHLFEGNSEQFKSTVDHLEHLNDYKQAKDFLDQTFSWNNDQEEVQEFYELLERRFL